MTDSPAARQDREFFDNNQSGVLQERLNKDTEDLARTIIQQPKNLLSALTRITTKSIYLYWLSPGLFWVGLCIPVPICCLVETLGFKKLRTADTKIGKVNDQAAANTSDLLREISTVRQFGMEEEELRNFTTIATVRAARGHLSGLRVFLSKTILYGGCMGAQAAQRTKTAVFGPGSGASSWRRL